MNSEQLDPDVKRLAEETMERLSTKAIHFYKYRFKCITESEYAMILTGSVDAKRVNRVFHFFHIKPHGTQVIDKKYFSVIESYLKKDVDCVSKNLQSNERPLRIVSFHIERILYTPSETVDHLVTIEVSGLYIPMPKGA